MQNHRVNFFSKAPSGPPLDVAFISRTKDSLSVSWQAPDEDVRNGKLTGYQVCYSDQRYLENPTCIATSTTLSHTINNLQQTTKYFVTVSAGTSAGFGTKSLEINKTTNGSKCLYSVNISHREKVKKCWAKLKTFFYKKLMRYVTLLDFVFIFSMTIPQV